MVWCGVVGGGCTWRGGWSAVVPKRYGNKAVGGMTSAQHQADREREGTTIFFSCVGPTLDSVLKSHIVRCQTFFVWAKNRIAISRFTESSHKKVLLS